MNKMAKLYLLSALLFLIFSNRIKAQDFLQTKYSINDIKKQRENFKNEKVRSIIVKDGYSEKIYEVNTEGKILFEKGNSDSDNPYTIIYNYDNNGNLINFTGPFAHEFYEYDKKGNVIEVSLDLYTHDFVYDGENRLIKMNSESEEGEVCPFDKINYSEFLIIEKTYPCCEGNYAMRYVYEHSDAEQLLKIINYTKNCSTGMEEINNTEEYFYSDTSKLPYKMIKESQEINFTYEYYN